MAKLRFNGAGVSSAKRLATSAKNSSTSVREGIETIQRNMQSDVAARNNIETRLVNVKTNVSQVERDIQAIYRMVDGATQKYRDTEAKVVRWGAEVAQGKKLSYNSTNRGAFSVGGDSGRSNVTKTISKEVGDNTSGSRIHVDKQKNVEKLDKYNIKEFLEDIKDIQDKDKRLLETLLEDVKNNYSEAFSNNFLQELVTNTIQSSGGYIQKTAGIVNIATALNHGPQGTNSFVIVNPKVASNTLKASNIGGKLGSIMYSTGAKVAIPVIGGVIDYVGMRSDGEEVGDAVVKSAAHVAIGLGGGKAGAAIGATIGSVIPGAGTAVGGAIGFVAGVAITTVGNVAFDAVWDNKEKIVETGKEIISDAVEITGKVINKGKEIITDAVETTGDFINETKKVTQKYVNKTKDSINSFVDDIGDACIGGWNSLRTIWA